MNKGYDRRYCEQFQNSLTYERIDKIWKIFRQAGNSQQGKITRNTFKKVMLRDGTKNQKFLDKLFDRFKFQKIADVKVTDAKQKDQFIDLQDFVIGMVLISLISFLNKVKYIFYLTDLDEDGCLSLQEIQNMIQRIEKIFCKENSPAKVQSFSLLIDMAHKKAQRNYKEILFILYRNNPGLKNDEGGLITGQQFIEALSGSFDLYTEQKFIPLNLSFAEVIQNVGNQLTIKINQDNKNDFCKFRKQLYMILQKNKDAINKDTLKYPWKVEIIKDKKFVQNLVHTEKIVEKEKKNQKGGHKMKSQFHKNQYKDMYDQKSTEQTLESYRLKVKKMIETKEDPRLNIKFDKTVRK